MTVGSSPLRIQVINTLEKGIESQKDATTPNWLVALVNRKRILVPISFPINDIVSKYTNKTQKPKRTKSTTRITFDIATGRSIAKVATYNKKEGIDELDLNNFEITCIDLGVMNHETKEHWTLTKQIVL